MRTDVTKQQSESLETMKVRKTLQPLQEAAGDKENLVGAGRMPPSGKDKTPLKKIVSASPASKVEKNKSTSKTDKKITANDLTSQAGPSEHYWEVLAERRKVALDQALTENKKLIYKISTLNEENEELRKMLLESSSLLNAMTEMLEQNETDQSVNDTSTSSVVTDEVLERPRDE